MMTDKWLAIFRFVTNDSGNTDIANWYGEKYLEPMASLPGIVEASFYALETNDPSRFLAIFVLEDFSIVKSEPFVGWIEAHKSDKLIKSKFAAFEVVSTAAK